MSHKHDQNIPLTLTSKYHTPDSFFSTFINVHIWQPSRYGWKGWM